MVEDLRMLHNSLKEFNLTIFGAQSRESGFFKKN
jgi:hypothetical protein